MNLAKDDNIDTIYTEVDWWNDSSHITFLRCGWKEYEKD
jgi:hypothetical protein